MQFSLISVPPLYFVRHMILFPKVANLNNQFSGHIYMSNVDVNFNVLQIIFLDKLMRKRNTNTLKKPER